MSLTLLGSAVLASDASSVVFDSIPSGYKNLVLRWVLDTTGTNASYPTIFVNDIGSLSDPIGEGWNSLDNDNTIRVTTGSRQTYHNPDFGEHRWMNYTDTDKFIHAFVSTASSSSANYQNTIAVAGILMGDYSPARFNPVTKIEITAGLQPDMLAGSVFYLFGEG